mgnify:CR=1 FL=1|jgi:hypothetical protein
MAWHGIAWDRMGWDMIGISISFALCLFGSWRGTDGQDGLGKIRDFSLGFVGLVWGTISSIIHITSWTRAPSLSSPPFHQQHYHYRQQSQHVISFVERFF